MIVKKCGKMVLGAELTSDEKKAIEIESRKIIADMDKQNAIEIDSIYIYALHTLDGFGEERLKKHFKYLWTMFDELKERYEMDSQDMPWLYKQKLKEKGFDVEAWAKEMETITVNLE